MISYDAHTIVQPREAFDTTVDRMLVRTRRTSANQQNDSGLRTRCGAIMEHDDSVRPFSNPSDSSWLVS